MSIASAGECPRISAQSLGKLRVDGTERRRRDGFRLEHVAQLCVGDCEVGAEIGAHLIDLRREVGKR